MRWRTILEAAVNSRTLVEAIPVDMRDRLVHPLVALFAGASLLARRRADGQLTRPAIRLTAPPTITTPNRYESNACTSAVRRTFESRSVVSETW
jgi:hypothetical protein